MKSCASFTCCLRRRIRCGLMPDLSARRKEGTETDLIEIKNTLFGNVRDGVFGIIAHGVDKALPKHLMRSLLFPFGCVAILDTKQCRVRMHLAGKSWTTYLCIVL